MADQKAGNQSSGLVDPHGNVVSSQGNTATVGSESKFVAAWERGRNKLYKQIGPILEDLGHLSLIVLSLWATGRNIDAFIEAGILTEETKLLGWAGGILLELMIIASIVNTRLGRCTSAQYKVYLIWGWGSYAIAAADVLLAFGALGAVNEGYGQFMPFMWLIIASGFLLIHWLDPILKLFAKFRDALVDQKANNFWNQHQQFMHEIRLATISRQTQSHVINTKAQRIRKRLYDADTRSTIEEYAEEDLRQVLEYYGPIRMLSEAQLAELEEREKKALAAPQTNGRKKQKA